MTEYAGDWMYVPEFARLLGITQATLRTYHAQGRVPHAERDPRTGYLRWPSSAALACVEGRRARRTAGQDGMRGRAIGTHVLVSQVDDITDSELDDAQVAEILGVSSRTVYRHRSGKCGCLTNALRRR